MCIHMSQVTAEIYASFRFTLFEKTVIGYLDLDKSSELSKSRVIVKLTFHSCY